MSVHSEVKTRASEGVLYPLLALLLALVAALPLLVGSGIVNTRAGGDAPFLLQRVHQLAANLRAGVFPAHWMPAGAHGLGYPFFNFYASLPYYIAALLDIVGFGALWGIKLTQTLGFLLAGVGLYACAREAGAERPGALLASCVYTFAPFHLVNIYVRGDSLSEFYAFALYPLIVWSLLRMGKRPSWGAMGALAGSFAGLMLTHNISALVFTPLVCLWLAVQAVAASPDQRWRLLVMGAMGLGLGLAASGWFWIPALREQSLVQLQDQTTGYFHYAGHFKSLDMVQPRLIHSYVIDAQQDPFSLGLVQAVIGLGGLVALAVRQWRKQKPGTVYWIVACGLLIYLWLITPTSRWLWDRLPLLLMTQFPWRLLSVGGFCLALLTSLIPDLVWRAKAHWVAVGLGLLLLVAGLGGLDVDRLPLREADVSSERLMLYETYSGNIGSTVRYEYLPKEMVPRPHVSGAQWDAGSKPAPRALEGELLRADLLDQRPEREEWRLTVASKTLLAFQTTFYAGWEATVDGQPQGVEPLAGLGLIGLRLEPGEHLVTFVYRPTPTRRYAAWLSLLAVGFLVVVAVVTSWPHRKKLLGALGIVVAVGVLAWGAVRLLEPGEAALDGPLVMDFHRAPYLHPEPQGIRFGEAWLEAYQVSAREVNPGQTVRLDTVWRATQPNLTARVELVGATGHLYEPAPRWLVQEAAINGTRIGYDLDLPDTLAPGLYALTLQVLGKEGPVEVATAQGVSMGAPALGVLQVHSVGRSDGTEASLAAFGPEQALPVISLLDATGTDVASHQYAIDLIWRCERQPPLNYMLSVRLYDRTGERLASRDIQPLLGGYPTSLWQVGEIVSDRVLLILPADAGMAGLTAEVVLYDRISLAAVGSARVSMDAE